MTPDMNLHAPLGQPGPHYEVATSRRDFLLRAGGGFGALALVDLLAGRAAGAAGVDPMASRTGHHKARARSVIFLFIEGGPSHLDLFDRKPLLNKLAGQPLPESFGTVLTAMGEHHSPLLACPRKWKRHGESGLWVSDWLPHVATIADELTVIRSCWCDGLNHVGSVCQMNTGAVLAGRPSLGSWAVYGLGTENQNLPSFVVLLDNPHLPVGGVRNWGTGFMPSTYQGTLFKSGDIPIDHLRPPKGVSDERQHAKLRLLRRLNTEHAESRSDRNDLEARIGAYELAFRMQAKAPEAVDIGGESKRTLEMYGLENKTTASIGRSCLLARRLVERGVRFVQIYCGSGSRWDAHSHIEKNHSQLCQASDQPIAALVKDLKQRGLLDETLVVWGGEFGRTPMSEKGDGRDHNPTGFTMWMAGGGALGGRTIGATDQLGLHAVEDRAHVHDLHATILHLLGLDHMRLSYLHNGRLERPTINTGRVIEQVYS